MSKPSYYYKLDIYNPPPRSSESHAVPSKPPGWYYPIGLGKRLISLMESTVNLGNNLTTKGSDLLQYASSLEGTVKLGFIVSSTCAGGVMSLLIQPKGKIRKLFYPSLLLASSSAICYPSHAYVISKTGLVHAYTGGQAVYSYAKNASERFSEWRNLRKDQREQMSLIEEMADKDLTARLDEEMKDEDIASLKNPPMLFSDVELTPKAAAEDEANGNSTAENKTEDMGQSLAEDKELYTTRL